MFPPEPGMDLEVVRGLPGGSDRKPHVRCSQVFRRVPEQELFPLDIERKLRPDDIARQVKAGLAALDLGVLRGLYEDHGGVAYDPETMLSIVFLAWVQGIRSARDIADRCEMDIRFMYVSGGSEPDFRSVVRFLHRVAPLLEELQRQFAEACISLGFLVPRRVAVDGTKLRSAASQAARWLKDPEAEALEELGFEVPGSTDPDARVVKGRGGRVLGYNALAAVDCDTGLVLACEVSQSSSDRGELSGMAESLVDQCGKALEGVELVADSGFDSYEGLQRCEDLGMDAVVPPQDDSALFWTVVSENEVVCPMGEGPAAISTSMIHGRKYTTYAVESCPSCRFYGICCSSPRGRSLKAPVGCDPANRVIQAHRARSPDGREAMRERMATVEPFFGMMKWNQGMGRLHYRGLGGACMELRLTALARNVRILGRALAALHRAVFRLFGRIFGAGDRPVTAHRPA